MKYQNNNGKINGEVIRTNLENEGIIKLRLIRTESSRRRRNY